MSNHFLTDADALIDYWFFGARKEAAWDRAKRMAKNILIDQVEGNATDVNENAVQFIVDWVLSNKAYFGTKAIGTCLGFRGEYRVIGAMKASKAFPRGHFPPCSFPCSYHCYYF